MNESWFEKELWWMAERGYQLYEPAELQEIQDWRREFMRLFAENTIKVVSLLNKKGGKEDI